MRIRPDPGDRPHVRGEHHGEVGTRRRALDRVEDELLLRVALAQALVGDGVVQPPDPDPHRIRNPVAIGAAGVPNDERVEGLLGRALPTGDAAVDVAA